MGFFNKYPYTDFHELNLDWLLCQFKNLVADWDAFEAEMRAKYEELRHDMNALMEYMYEHFQDAVNAIFADLIASGEINQILRNALGGGLVDNSKYSPFAQVLPVIPRAFGNTLYQQGFCIGEYNGNPVFLNCFTDTSDPSNDLLVFTRFDTGVEVTRFNVPCGHCNSATYNKQDGNWYIVSDYDGYVLQVNGTLDGTYYVHNIHNANGAQVNPWQIAYNNGIFHVRVQGGYIMQYDDLDADPIKTTAISSIPNVTYQGMAMDDLYYYFPCGNNINTSYDNNNVNYIDVRYHDGKPAKVINVEYPLEMEEIDILDGVCYLASNTQNAGLIVKIDLYKYNAHNYLTLHEIPNIVWREMYVFIDQTYTGFFMDGSGDKPLSSLAWWYLFLPSNISYLNVLLKSDCDNNSFTVYSEFAKEIKIAGISAYSINPDGTYNLTYAMKNVRRIYMKGNGFVAYYIRVLGVAYDAADPTTERDAIYSQCNQQWFDHLEIGDQSNPVENYVGLEICGGRFTLNNYKIYNSFNLRAFDIRANGVLYTGTYAAPGDNYGSSESFLLGSMAIDSSFAWEKINWTNKSSILRTWSGNNKTIDTDTFCKPIQLQMGTGCTFTNAPTGFTTDVKQFECLPTGTSRCIQKFYKADGSMAVKIL